MGGRIVKPIYGQEGNDKRHRHRHNGGRDLQNQRIFLCEKCYRKGNTLNSSDFCELCSDIDLNVSFYPYSRPLIKNNELINNSNGELFKDSLETLFNNLSCCGLVKQDFKEENINNNNICYNLNTRQMSTFVDNKLPPQYVLNSESLTGKLNRTKTILEINNLKNSSSLKLFQENIIPYTGIDMATSISKLQLSKLTKTDLNQSYTAEVKDGERDEGNDKEDEEDNFETTNLITLQIESDDLEENFESTTGDLMSFETIDLLELKSDIFTDDKDESEVDIFQIDSKLFQLIKNSDDRHFNTNGNCLILKTGDGSTICIKVNENDLISRIKLPANEEEYSSNSDVESDITYREAFTQATTEEEQFTEKDSVYSAVDNTICSEKETAINYSDKTTETEDINLKEIENTNAICQSCLNAAFNSIERENHINLETFKNENFYKCFLKNLNNMKLLKTSCDVGIETEINLISRASSPCRIFNENNCSNCTDTATEYNTESAQNDINLMDKDKDGHGKNNGSLDEDFLNRRKNGSFLNSNTANINNNQECPAGKDGGIKTADSIVYTTTVNNEIFKMDPLLNFNIELSQTNEIIQKCSNESIANAKTFKQSDNFSSDSNMEPLKFQNAFTNFKDILFFKFPNKFEKTSGRLNLNKTKSSSLIVNKTDSICSSSSTSSTSYRNTINDLNELKNLLKSVENIIDELLPHFSIEVMQEFKKISVNPRLFTALSIVTCDLNIAKSILKLIKNSKEQFQIKADHPYLNELQQILDKIKTGLQQVEKEKTIWPTKCKTDVDPETMSEFNMDIFRTMTPLQSKLITVKKSTSVPSFI